MKAGVKIKSSISWRRGGVEQRGLTSHYLLMRRTRGLETPVWNLAWNIHRPLIKPVLNAGKWGLKLSIWAFSLFLSTLPGIHLLVLSWHHLLPISQKGSLVGKGRPTLFSRRWLWKRDWVVKRWNKKAIIILTLKLPFICIAKSPVW